MSREPINIHFVYWGGIPEQNRIEVLAQFEVGEYINSLPYRTRDLSIFRVPIPLPVKSLSIFSEEHSFTNLEMKEMKFIKERVYRVLQDPDTHDWDIIKEYAWRKVE